jgi:hypothetical protein
MLVEQLREADRCKSNNAEARANATSSNAIVGSVSKRSRRIPYYLMLLIN